MIKNKVSKELLNDIKSKIETLRGEMHVWAMLESPESNQILIFPD